MQEQFPVFKIKHLVNAKFLSSLTVLWYRLYLMQYLRNEYEGYFSLKLKSAISFVAGCPDNILWRYSVVE